MNDLTDEQRTDHTAAIAEAAREFVRCHLAWFATGRPYPAAEWDALVAAVEAERDAQSRPDTDPNTQP